MSSSYLLDANALIALVIAEHEHHGRVTAWITEVDGVAPCPITEGAMVRYLIRVGETAATASQLLAALRESPTVEFWSDSISYTDPTRARYRAPPGDRCLPRLTRCQPPRTTNHARPGARRSTQGGGAHPLTAHDVGRLAPIGQRGAHIRRSQRRPSVIPPSPVARSRRRRRERCSPPKGWHPDERGFRTQLPDPRRARRPLTQRCHEHAPPPCL